MEKSQAGDKKKAMYFWHMEEKMQTLQYKKGAEQELNPGDRFLLFPFLKSSMTAHILACQSSVFIYLPCLAAWVW